jgi:hypothetical protein
MTHKADAVWVGVKMTEDGDEVVAVHNPENPDHFLPLVTSRESNLPMLMTILENVAKRNPSHRMEMRKFFTYEVVKRYGDQ